MLQGAIDPTRTSSRIAIAPAPYTMQQFPTRPLTDDPHTFVAAEPSSSACARVVAVMVATGDDAEGYQEILPAGGGTPKDPHHKRILRRLAGVLPCTGQHSWQERPS